MRRFFLVMLSLILVGALAGAGTSLAKRTDQYPSSVSGITVSPSRLHFGHVAAYGTKTEQVTITNNTGYAITFESAQPVDVSSNSGFYEGEFSVGDTCTNLPTGELQVANGGTCNIDVTLQGMDHKGRFAAEAAFSFQDPAPDVEGTVTVYTKLSGGVA